MRVLLALLLLGLTVAISNLHAQAAQAPAAARSQLAARMERLAGAPLPPTARKESVFTKLTAATTFKEMLGWAGAPDADIGSGIHIYVYRLDDGSEVWVGTPGGDRIIYARQMKGGQLQQDLLHQPVSAPRPEDGELKTCRLGFFMPKEDVYNPTLDVTERIVRFYKSPAKDIPLAKYPLLSDKDIQSYDWRTHTLTFNKNTLYRIRPPSVHGAPFVVVVDGEPLYVGAFYTGLSSIPCPLPTLLMDDIRRTNTVQIGRAYPTQPFGGGAPDPRSDPRLKKVLQELGKLKE
jgi:hypothetical protein